MLVGVIGYFGERLCAVAERLGGVVTRLDGEWGKPLAPEAVIAAIRRTQPAVVALVHAETSTGVLQPLDGIGAAAHEAGALLVLDTVTSLGGHPVAVDDWGVDACYSGSQKCLGAPSGLAPFTLSARALARLEQRATPPGGYYLDARLLSQYWDERQYHHTISAPLIYALYTALRRLEAEGLERRWARHHLQHRAFRAGCAALGLEFLPDEQDSLWPLNAVRVPEGLDDARARAALRDHHNIEIGGGMGPLKGKLWRVGLMGYGARQEFVLELLGALELMLATHGHAHTAGRGRRRRDGRLCHGGSAGRPRPGRLIRPSRGAPPPGGVATRPPAAPAARPRPCRAAQAYSGGGGGGASAGSGGRSPRLVRPKWRRKASVVLKSTGRPTVSRRPLSAMRPRLSRVLSTPLQSTPRNCSTWARVTGWR